MVEKLTFFAGVGVTIFFKDCLLADSRAGVFLVDFGLFDSTLLTLAALLTTLLISLFVTLTGFSTDWYTGRPCDSCLTGDACCCFTGERLTIGDGDFDTCLLGGYLPIGEGLSDCFLTDDFAGDS